MALFILLDGVSFLILGAGADRSVILRVTGNSWEQIESSLPTVANYINNLAYIVGLSLAGFGLMIVGASVTGYRKGQKWAWLLSWYLPLYFLVAGVITYREGVNISLDAFQADILFFLLWIVYRCPADFFLLVLSSLSTPTSAMILS